MPQPALPRLLLVDANDSRRAALALRLRNAGYEPQDAATADEALAMTRLTMPALILVDSELPKLQEFLHKLPNEAAAIIQLSSEQLTVQARVHAAQYGVCAHILHSEPEEILATVQSLLRLRGAAEAARNKSESRFKLVEDGTELGVWFCDLPFNALHWNANVKRHFFLEPDAVVDIHLFFARICPEDREPTRNAIEQSISTGELYDVVFRTQSEDGTETHSIRALGRAFYNPAGEAVHFDGITVDMTEHRRAEEAVRVATRRKDEFLANMSHEIRTPMNAIMGLSHILAISEPLTGKQQECIRTLQASSQSLLALINDLLDIAKIESDDVNFEEVPFSLRSLAEDAVNGLLPRAMEKNLALGLDYDEAAPKLCIGDPLRVKQILTNLLSNAVKFTETGQVMLSISETEGGMRIAVRDTGIGISSDKFETIFNKFYQGDGSITRRYGGTGLGLAITRTLVERMRGRIELQSREGEGSTFTVDLPLASAEPKRIASTANDTPHDPKRPLILLVEDYPPNVLVATCLLDALDVQYEVAQNGQEALEMTEARRYDLILMDVQMPIVDGYTATRRLRERETERRIPTTPIIGITAYALSGDREKCLGAGMNDYISKPFNTIELKGKILTLLATGPEQRSA